MAERVDLRALLAGLGAFVEASRMLNTCAVPGMPAVGLGLVT